MTELKHVIVGVASPVLSHPLAMLLPLGNVLPGSPKFNILWQFLVLISCVGRGRGSPVEVEGAEIIR